MGRLESAERQIRNHVLNGELARKGTAPSFLNLEADRRKPGPLTNLSAKGYERLEREMLARMPRREGETDADRERSVRVALSSWMANEAIRWLATESQTFGSWFAMRRASEDPGVVRRWEDGSEPHSAAQLAAYHHGVRSAAARAISLWPWMDLLIPVREEDEPQKTLIHARNADNNRKKSEEARERHREIARSIRAIRRRSGLGTDAAIEAYRDRLARMNAEDVPSAPTCYRSLAAVPEGEAEGRDDEPPAA